MKTVIEFGVRGGYHIDNIVLPSVKVAMQTAAAIVSTLDSRGVRPQYFAVNRAVPRATWQNRTHFVAVSILDGVPRGAASQALWKKEVEA
jgi:hypothetical protein